METFFGFVMYCIFGKRWLLWQMKQGYRGAVFVNETEVQMTKSRMATISKEIETMEAELEGFKAVPPHTFYDFLEDKKAIPTQKQEYDAQKKCDEQNKVITDGLANRIKSRTNDLMREDKELQQAFAVTYSNRLKWDFIKNYKIVKTYADDGYADQFKPKSNEK